VEYVAEWIIAWCVLVFVLFPCVKVLILTRIPFYYLFKTVFLLYLALPQTQGSSYLYVYHLQPFFRAHEMEIDAAIASLKTQALTYIQDLARRMWAFAMSSLSQPRAADLTEGAPVARGASMDMGATPSLNDPISGPAQLAGNLWRSYGPTLLASGAALLHQSAAPGSPFGLNASAQTPARPTPARSQTLERRRQLEAELAALGSPPLSPTALGYDTAGFSPQPTPTAEAAVSRTTSAASSADLRQRSALGPFEEVEVPSDIEDEQGFVPTAGRDGPVLRPVGSGGRRTSWFGWTGAPGQGGYERVKDE
jgi:receptor expression-enhancing protein 1/2/3/4